MAKLIIIVIFAVACVVLSKPVDNEESYIIKIGSDPVSEMEIVPPSAGHLIQKRFINPSLAAGGFGVSGVTKMRTKRSYEEECEKLRLCKLHARSDRNFFAAFELYFVNRENARLWDHQAHSTAECNERFSCYDR